MGKDILEEELQHHKPMDSDGFGAYEFHSHTNPETCYLKALKNDTKQAVAAEEDIDEEMDLTPKKKKNAKRKRDESEVGGSRKRPHRLPVRASPRIKDVPNI